MSSTSAFIGEGFFIASAAIKAPATVRITYSNVPLASSNTGVHDALNPANYGLSGPGSIRVIGCATVGGDPLSIDLALSQPLITGTWIVSAANVQTADADSLQAPTSAAFVVTVVSTLEPVSMGAVDDDAESILKKHAPTLVGPAWDALIAAIATGDQNNWDAAASAFDQLFISSASGVYLDRGTADYGLQRPDGVGIGDSLYSKYSIKVTNTKLTQQIMLEILEIFYGSDTTRAFLVTGLGEPFALADQQTLTVLLDELNSIQIIFSAADFINIHQATAVEVAAAITRSFRAQNLKAFAVAYLDPETSQNRVRIYTSALGLRGGVRITGGQAQNGLQFPTSLLTTTVAGHPAAGVSVGDGWVASIPVAGTMRMTVTGATTTDFSKVVIGDYVNIFGSPFNVNNQGSFPVTNVDVRYVTGVLTQFIEVENANTFVGTTVITNINDVLFFRPSRATINSNRAVVVSQPRTDELDVILPATTSAVQRSAGTAAYIQMQPAQVPTGISRLGTTITVQMPSAPAIEVGEYIIVDDAYGSSTTPADSSGSAGHSSYNPVTTWAAVDAQTGTAVDSARSTGLTGGSALVVGGRNTTGATLVGGKSLARLFTVSSLVAQANGGIQALNGWTNLPNIPVGRELHAVTSLTDAQQGGNALVTGGWDGDTGEGGSHTPMLSSYIYQAGPQTWSSAVNMATARCLHAQVTLSGGQVLVCGGANTNTTTTASAELFTPSVGGGSFSTAASMNVARQGHSAILLPNGTVLVCGGRALSGGATVGSLSGGAYLFTCEIYDPVGNTWTPTGNMSFSRYRAGATLLSNGQVLIVGGYGAEATSTTSPAALTSAEIYDSNSGCWYQVDNLPEAISDADGHVHATYLTARGQALVVGNSKDAFYFNAATRRWRRTPIGVGGQRAQSTLTQLVDGTVVLSGGVDSQTTNSSLSAFLFIGGSDSISAGGLNGPQLVTSVVGNNISYVTPGVSAYTVNANTPSSFPQTAATMTPATAQAGTIPGPYLLDPNQGVQITSQATTTAMDLNAGQRYRSLVCAANSVANFPDAPGFIMIQFGYDNQIGPISYLGKISNSELLLDYSFKMPTTAGSGATVTLLNGKAPYDPNTAVGIGAFYLTASPAGRVAAEAAINNVVAAGVDVNIVVQYPGDRGLGGEGLPAAGPKISDKVAVWGGDNLDAELGEARTEIY